jgi:hypothetical protein
LQTYQGEWFDLNTNKWIHKFRFLNGSIKLKNYCKFPFYFYLIICLDDFQNQCKVWFTFVYLFQFFGFIFYKLLEIILGKLDWNNNFFHKVNQNKHQIAKMRPLYTMVKTCNHGNFETPQNSSKCHPMKNQ